MSLVNRIPIGKESPDVINCIIEIPKDTNAKYEYDEELDIFRLNRCLYSSMRYTSSYGFIPQTFALDNDPLDIVIYNNIPIQTGTLVEVKPIAVLDMTDNGDEDYKIVGVPMSHVRNTSRCAILMRTGSPPPRISFHYKSLENKEVEVKGWLSKTAAKKIIKNAHRRWCDLLHNG